MLQRCGRNLPIGFYAPTHFLGVEIATSEYPLRHYATLFEIFFNVLTMTTRWHPRLCTTDLHTSVISKSFSLRECYPAIFLVFHSVWSHRHCKATYGYK